MAQFDVKALTDLINTATEKVMKQINEMQGREDIDIGAMFKMQMNMNKLSQLSEMSSSVVASAHASLSSMARNVK